MKEYNWQVTELCSKGIFHKNETSFRKAIDDGFFFIKQPPDLCTEFGDLFASNFFLPKSRSVNNMNSYRGFREYDNECLGKFEGYFQREKDQTEQFYLEKRHWNDIYPKHLVEQAEKMLSFSLCVLDSVFQLLKIPEDIILAGTGKCLSREGTHHLTFNHFRHNMKIRGLNTHKDSSWITVLRSIDPGLEVFQEGTQKWLPINPMENYFIVNFGCAMEIFTRNTSQPVAAVAHRVKQIEKSDGERDRFSYAIFVDSSLDKNVSEGLYEYFPEQGIKLFKPLEQFVDNLHDKTYTGNDIGLY